MFKHHILILLSLSRSLKTHCEFFDLPPFYRVGWHRRWTLLTFHNGPSELASANIPLINFFNWSPFPVKSFQDRFNPACTKVRVAHSILAPPYSAREVIAHGFSLSTAVRGSFYFQTFEGECEASGLALQTLGLAPCSTKKVSPQTMCQEMHFRSSR